MSLLKIAFARLDLFTFYDYFCSKDVFLDTKKFGMEFGIVGGYYYIIMFLKLIYV